MQWEVRGFWEEQDSAGARDGGVPGGATMGTPVTCCPLGLSPAAGTGGREVVSGAALLLPSLGGHWEASFFLALLLPVTSPPQPPPIPGTGGHRPYLSLQRHGPHGQVAHRLIGDLPPPHREVVEGVRQFFGVIF